MFSFPDVALTVRQGPNAGQKYTAHKDSLVLGRQASSDIQINDRQISPQHARIAWQNGRFVITDLGSLNGTTINGRPLTGSFPLRNGDIVGLGNISLAFAVLRGAAASPRSRSAGATAPLSGFDDESGEVDEPNGPGNGPLTQKKWPVIAGGACTCLAVVVCLVAVIAVVGLKMVPSLQAAPEVRILEPADGAQVQAGQPVTILATARGDAGVTKAELWVDGVLNATITSSKPGGQAILRVEQPWVPAAGGPHNLVIKAYGPSGNVSEPVNLALTAVDQPTAVAAAPTPTPAPAPKSTPVVRSAAPEKVAPPTKAPAAALTACNNDAAFAADVTVPDRSTFKQGAAFNKTWRVRNSGTCAWDGSYKLVYVSGSKLGAPDSQPVAATAAGGSVDITVPMQAPGQYGSFSAVWQMANAKGEPFGQDLSVVILVPSPATATPVPPPPQPTQPPAPAASSSGLTADKDTVNNGECTTLHATANGVAAAWLEGSAITGGKMDKQVCPCKETTYTLDVQLSSGDHQKFTKTIKVNNGSCSGDSGTISVRDISVDPDDVVVGKTATIRVRFKNVTGNDENDAFDVDLSIIDISNDDNTDDLKTQTVENLAAGRDQTLSWSYAFKDYVTYTLRARAKDSTKDVQFKPDKN
jgi:hypothetical protein